MACPVSRDRVRRGARGGPSGACYLHIFRIAPDLIQGATSRRGVVRVGRSIIIETLCMRTCVSSAPATSGDEQHKQHKLRKARTACRVCLTGVRAQQALLLRKAHFCAHVPERCLPALNGHASETTCIHVEHNRQAGRQRGIRSCSEVVGVCVRGFYLRVEKSINGSAHQWIGNRLILTEH